jgi:hypothetical protein
VLGCTTGLMVVWECMRVALVLACELVVWVCKSGLAVVVVLARKE